MSKIIKNLKFYGLILLSSVLFDNIFTSITINGYQMIDRVAVIFIFLILFFVASVVAAKILFPDWLKKD